MVLDWLGVVIYFILFQFCLNLHMEGFVVVLFDLVSLYVFLVSRSMTEVCEGVPFWLS